MNLLSAFSFFVMSVYMFISQSSNAQTPIPSVYKLFVNLKNAPFDSLYLQDYTEGRYILIPGRKTQAFTWEIIVPNNLVSDSENMVLLASPYNPKTNSKKMIRFVDNRSTEKIIVTNVGVEDEANYIYGSYADTTVFPEEQLRFKVNNRDTVAVGKMICADFNLIIDNPNSDIAIRAQDPFFSWFIDANDRSISYDDYLTSYIQISKEHPDSRFLINNIASNITKYRSKDDIRKVYENLSAKHRNSIWAKEIESLIYQTKFPNKVLPTGKKTYQKIIQDTSKYNLVIFTASWCVPCIEEIPLLKKVYKDLGKDLILTYVSIDNKSGVPAFEKLVRTKKIPWRTLFAYENLQETERTYFIGGIPHAILINPDQTFKIIDVRKPVDRSKLYTLIQSIKN